MCFAKATVFKVVLPLVLVLCLFSGSVAWADSPPAPTPPPPNTSIQLQTYGTLPVMILNLTASFINYSVTPGVPSAYTQAGAPVAIGLHGWSYVSGSSTPTFNNPTTPNTVPNGMNGMNNPSLNPVATPVANTSNYQPSTNLSFLNVFNLFPSWSGAVQFPNTNYQNFTSSSGASLGATPGPALNTTPAWYTTQPATAYAQSMSGVSNTTINLDIAGFTTYTVNINSLGGKTSGAQTPSPNSSSSPTNWLTPIVDVIGDVAILADPDVIAVSVMLYGLYESIKALVDSPPNPNYTNVPYPAAYNGIGVTASGGYLYALDGSNNFLMYGQTKPNISMTQSGFQNGVFLYTWRMGQSNTGSQERNSADTLVVAVISEAIYTAYQARQFIHNPSAATATNARYNPTKEQAEDTWKLLGILTAIAKKNPQDSQKIIELFGFHGQYAQTKHDPNAVAGIKPKLKEVFIKYQREFPVIEQYLAKL